MSSVIDSIERSQQRQGLPSFAPGDRVRVHFQVVEGSRRRTQVFEGIVLRRQGSGSRETFTVRKQSFGVGVERTFPLHSPKIERLEIAARGAVRRAKLYYLRGRIGKAARVAERRWGIDDELIAAPAPPEPEVEGSEDEAAEAAGPVAEEDSSSAQAAGEEPTSAPPADEAPAEGDAAEPETAAEKSGDPSAAEQEQAGEAEGAGEPAVEVEDAVQEPAAEPQPEAEGEAEADAEAAGEAPGEGKD